MYGITDVHAWMYTNLLTDMHCLNESVHSSTTHVLRTRMLLPCLLWAWQFCDIISYIHVHVYISAIAVKCQT